METNENAGWGSNVPAAPEYGSPQWVIERDRRLAAWEQSKIDLETAKAREMELRKEFVDFSFDPNKKEGTERIDLNNGYQAKAVKKLNYTFKSDREGVEVADAVDLALQRLEAVGPEGKFIASRLVKWTPSLSLSEYRDLAPQFKAVIDPVIETKEGAPSLEIVAPKGKK